MFKIFKKYTYNFLKKNNLIFVHKIIIILRRFFHQRKKININNKYAYFEIGDKNTQSFSGYYDVNPISKDGKYILYHQLAPNSDKISISIFDLNNKTKKKIYKTAAWSWQLGARLHWFNENQFFCNFQKEGFLKSAKIDLNGNIEEEYDYPVFSLDRNRRFNLFLNFKILENQRKGYGYNFDIQNYKNKNFIAIFDLVEKKIVYEIELNFLLNKLNEVNKNYYFNHLSWSTDSKSFLVYLVSTKPRISKLIYFENQDNFRIIDQIELISHHTWLSEKKILFYGKVNSDYGFYIFNFKENKIDKKFENEFSSFDGHPNTQDGSIVVIDAYPDRLGERKLYSLNLEKKDETEHICSLLSNYDMRDDLKCDLHPKYSEDSSKIAVDSSHNNFRQIVIFEKKNNLL